MNLNTMNINTLRPRGLTASQKRNLAGLVIGGLLALNEHWPQVTAFVGQHYHGLPIPPGVSLVLMLASYGVTSLSRALNRAKSGTGTGIVGDAPPATEVPALPPPNVALLPPSLPAAVTGLVVDDLLGLALKRLPAVEAQAIKAFAAQKLADLETKTAKNMTNMAGFLPGELAQYPSVGPSVTVAPVQAVIPMPAPEAAIASQAAIASGVGNTGGAMTFTPTGNADPAPPDAEATARAQALTEQGV